MRGTFNRLLAISAAAIGLGASALNQAPQRGGYWRPARGQVGSNNIKFGVLGAPLHSHVGHGRRPLVKAMGGRRQYLKTVKAMRRLQREEQARA